MSGMSSSLFLNHSYALGTVHSLLVGSGDIHNKGFSCHVSFLISFSILVEPVCLGSFVLLSYRCYVLFVFN